MPRYRRDVAPGSVQHVISRFAGREFVLDLPGARRTLLDCVGKVLRKSDWTAVAYALMGNHVHWLFVAGQTPLRTVFHPTHVAFARWLRRTHGGLGPVFGDRPRNVTMQGETAATVLAYIHNNPVRAAVVERALESAWTSHAMYVANATPPPWLNVELGLHLAGFGSSAVSRTAFGEFVEVQAARESDQALSGRDQEARRHRVRSLARLPLQLGSSTATIEDGTPRAIAPTWKPRECPARPDAPQDADQVVAMVAKLTGVDVMRMRSRSRTHAVARARKVAVVYWARELQQPVGCMARLLGLAPSSASSLLARPLDPEGQRALRELPRCAPLSG